MRLPAPNARLRRRGCCRFVPPAFVAPLPPLSTASSRSADRRYPTPAPAIHGHHVKLQIRCRPGPSNYQRAEDGDKNGNGETGPELTLGECIAIAAGAAAVAQGGQGQHPPRRGGYRALTNFGTVGTIVSPDLEIRKQQAKRGLMATSAEYQKLHNEVVQDVTRLYYTAVYAKQQKELADNVVARMDFSSDRRGLPEEHERSEGPGRVHHPQTAGDAERAPGGEEAPIDPAKLGRQKALAGLREVMGVDDRTFPFRIKDDALPVMDSSTSRSRRTSWSGWPSSGGPELVLAGGRGGTAFRLEVYAQGRVPFKRVVRRSLPVRTFTRPRSRTRSARPPTTARGHSAGNAHATGRQQVRPRVPCDGVRPTSRIAVREGPQPHRRGGPRGRSSTSNSPPRS